jgi:O-acetyl-ADP-ribose deacetylase (regulator of RNase III)
MSMRWTRKLGQLSVTVERTTCVVRASKTKDVLINAANESLAGAQLPYFPRGGPCPPPLPEGLGNNANSWGALETGPGFVFREQAVDGVVTSLGGPALRDLCARARPDGFGAGDAVATAAPGLPFETVVHAVAPFWESASWRADLLRAYAAAFELAAGRDVATPLLGAGARGAPVADASAAAAEAVAAAASAPRPPRSVSFGVVDDVAFDALVSNCACL